MEYPNEFIAAFNHGMLYEIGPFFDPKNPGVISGACATKAEKRMVGYVNDPQDRGGLTKYGIAKNANPKVDVQNLNLAGAMAIYYQNYWIASKCHQLTHPITVVHFDVAVNHGVGRAAQFLQGAVGVNVDGAIGPKTLSAVDCIHPATVIERISAIRAARYNAIVKNDPTQAKFLNGWLRRNNEVTQYALAQLS